MALTRLRFLPWLLASVLCLPPVSRGFDTPLSDTAVREAYFMGQRHDEGMARFFEKYRKRLPPPKSGPYISSVAFYTPYALVAEFSSRQTNYSAQQAQIAHGNQDEAVEIVIQVDFTNSYNALIARPTSGRSGAPVGYTLRPYTFWKDFEVQVFSGETGVEALHSSGDPNYRCSTDGGCTLTGATLTFEFLATAFDGDTALVHIAPPEGDAVAAEFDLAALR